MKITTAEEMRTIDAKAINEIGIPSIVLMENAGRCVKKVVEGLLDPDETVSIFVGKGNNGGDGLVVARYLVLSGYETTVYLLAKPEQFSGDALTNLKICQNLGIPIQTVSSKKELEKWHNEIEKSKVIVDSIFGTGLKGAVRGFYAEIIEYINSIDAIVVAVDLPSGLLADTGQVEGVCINADHTVTMGLPKRGLLLYPGAELAGRITVADIGFPSEVIEEQKISVNLIRKSYAAQLLPPRPRNAHKGTFGHVFVIAGSTGMTGAATLTSKAALRAGAGLVTLGIPASLNPILEVKLTEVMTLPLPETQEGTIAPEAHEKVVFPLEKADVVALGPGLSHNSKTTEFIHRLCRSIKCPKVIDADGINALSEAPELLERLSETTVLTPHPGEMARLIDSTVAEIQANRIEIAQDFAKKYGLTLVLKGVPTVIAGANGEVYLNIAGNPGMATAGMGDVLTGIIAGLMAQKMEPFEASILGVYLHGIAGDLTAESSNERGIIASDVLETLPDAITAL